MLNTKMFGELLKKTGFTFYSGVPCSLLKDLINYAINECQYIAAANEGEAVAIASGAIIGGEKSVVLMQNSGLTNAASPLISLNYPFKLPVLGFVSLRGEPGIPDEPQHELMGNITTKLLDLMQVKWQYLSSHIEEASLQLEQANQWIEKDHPYFFVVKEGIFSEEILQNKAWTSCPNQLTRLKNEEDQLPTRFQVLEVINQIKEYQTVQLTTTGKTGRELYELEDSQHNLYMVGSMGCVCSLGLGLSLVQKNKKIIVIDGDGSLLMRMGSLATNGYYQPANMLHLLLDNHSHDSTGGQSTVSQHVNFVKVSAACGYIKSIYIHNLKELESVINNWKETQGLTFLYMKIAKGSKKSLGRPKIKPYEVKERLQRFLKN